MYNLKYILAVSLKMVNIEKGLMHISIYIYIIPLNKYFKK